MKRLTTFLILLSAALLPAITWAQDTVTITNPLGETDPRLLIARVIRGILSLSGSIALLMFIYGGLLWLISTGNPEPIARGKKIITWAILGIIVIAGAFVAVNAVFNAALTGNVGGAQP